jgi:HEAT repeat protein
MVYLISRDAKMSAANGKIKFIILLLLIILRVHFPCLAAEKPSEEEIKSLIQNLKVESPLFDKSRERLVRIGPPAVAYLIRTLKDENYQVRTSAAFILGEIGDKRAVKQLIQSLKDKNRDVRYAAACALGDIKDKKALGPLIETLKDEHWEVRRDAVCALYELKDKKASAPLVETLIDKRWEVRQDAAFALRKLGDKKAIEPLIHTLNDENERVRLHVASALGSFRDKKVVEPLIQALKDEDEKVRQNAAWALNSIGDKRAADPLFHALKDSNKQVRMGVALALGRMGDKRAREPLIEVLLEGGGNERRIALFALGEIGDESSVQPLLHLYTVWASERLYPLGLIKHTLGKICQADIKPLIQALKHEKWQIREASAVILAEIRDPEAAGSLVQALEDKHLYVRHAALEALNEITTCKGFKTIDYPEEILIRKGDLLNLKEKITIKYKYYGKDIISNDGEYGHFSYMQTYSIKGNILYYDKVGKILPEAYHYFKESRFDGFQRHRGISCRANLLC